MATRRARVGRERGAGFFGFWVAACVCASVPAIASADGGAAGAGALAAASATPGDAAITPEVLPPPPPPPEPEAMPLVAPAPRRLHQLGFALDVGVPDFAGASLLYRPWKFLRLGGSLLYDYAGYGARAGVTVVPYFPIAPSLTLEAGHFFEANAARKLGVTDARIRPLLERFGYTFVNAQVGLELGHPDWVVLYVRAGLSRLWYRAKGASSAVAAGGSSDGSTRVTLEDPSIRAQLPDVKVGFLFFFH